MKISYNWLRDYVDYEGSPAELAGILTSTGLEVEGMEEFESVKGSLEGIVVGEVLACKPHPNADRLSLTRVDVGNGTQLPIVCGAPNVAAGQKVAVALPGTTLFFGEDSLTLKKTRIRGEVSDGMICAEDELGLGDDHAGILVLDPVWEPGTPLREVFRVVHDVVFEIGLTPNRIDGASHIGTARDLVAYLNLDEQRTTLNLPDVSSVQTDVRESDLSVEVRHTEACLRYSGVCLSDIRVTESPDWLKARLQAIGLKPINNVVDITNYVLHETGQPLHAFDAQKIAGNKVIIDTLPEGTRFTTLDGEERILTASDLMICNEKEGMCIGGVFGGLHSGVSAETRDVFLESACFNPVWIRKTARQHQLNTDSSFRFERGTDPNGTLYALKRAAQLMKDLAGARITSDWIDIYPEPVRPYPVFLSWKNLDRLIGIQIPRDTVRQILTLLDIRIASESESGLHLEVATYRVDVKREADVIEEILRIYGYNNVGISEQVHSTLSYAPKPDPEQLENRIATQLTGMGFHELMSNSLTKKEHYSRFLAAQADRLVELVNPLSADLNVMRQTLLFDALEAVRLNISHRRTNLKGFEFGNTYRLADPSKIFAAEGYDETRRLGLILTGRKTEENWNTPQQDVSFFQLKAVVENILMSLGTDLSGLTMSEPGLPVFTEGITWSAGQLELVSLGIVRKNLLDAFDTEQPVFFAEFNWDAVLKIHTGEIRFQPISRFPEVKRDLALILDENRSFGEIQQLAWQVERKLLKQVNLFDVFRNDKIGKHKKSYAVSFILQDDTKTLTDRRIDQIMNNLIAAFRDKLGASLR